jgi:hypothetical protein
MMGDLHFKNPRAKSEYHTKISTILGVITKPFGRIPHVSETVSQSKKKKNL